MQAVGWCAVFFINLPIVVVAFALAARVVGETSGTRDRRLDVPGVMLGAGLLAVITFAFIDAGHAGVGATPVLATILLAVGLLAGLLAVERRTADPMLPLGLRARADFSASNAVAGTMNLATLGLIAAGLLAVAAVATVPLVPAGTEH